MTYKIKGVEIPDAPKVMDDDKKEKPQDETAGGSSSVA